EDGLGRLVGTADLGGGVQLVLEIGHNGLRTRDLGVRSPWPTACPCARNTVTVARRPGRVPGGRGVRGTGRGPGAVRRGPRGGARGRQPSREASVAFDAARVARRPRATSSAAPSTR